MTRVQSGLRYLESLTLIQKIGNGQYLVSPKLVWAGDFFYWAECLQETKKQNKIVCQVEETLLTETIKPR